MQNPHLLTMGAASCYYRGVQSLYSRQPLSEGLTSDNLEPTCATRWVLCLSQENFPLYRAHLPRPGYALNGVSPQITIPQVGRFIQRDVPPFIRMKSRKAALVT